MKTKKIFIYLSLIAGIVIGCKKDFLNETSNRQVVYRQDYVVDLATLQQFLNGTYTMLSTGLFTGYQVIYPELVADNLKPVSTSVLSAQYNWRQLANENREGALNSTSQNLNGVSYGLYKIINASNFVIEKADEYKSMDDQKAKELKGQALTIRALCHFYLVNFFAQPYNFSGDGTNPGIAYVTSSNWTNPVSRQSVKQVYDNLIADLKQAAGLLPLNSTNTLTINSKSAKAILSRVYLYKDDFENSKNYAIDIINRVPLMTVANGYPDNIFKLTNPASSEVLFNASPGPSVSLGNSFTTAFAGRYLRNSIQFNATSDVALIITEQPNDVRKNWVVLASGKWNVTKFPQGVITDVTSVAGGNYYQPVIRCSELYLNASESYARLNKEDSARVYLNAIRRRANPLSPLITAGGSALIDSIYKERRKELAFEGLRMFDLQRWKKNVTRTDVLTSSPNQLIYPNNKAISPIPLLDVLVSGINQNPGY